MATTNFVDQTTVIEASWLNDVDEQVYPSTSKTSAHNNDEFILRDSQASYVPKKYTYANFKADVWAFLGSLITAGTSKTTPADADSFAICDSAASNATKKLTWANLKSALISTGTYSPTLTGVANVTSVSTTTFPWYYTRLGNLVTVTGFVAVTPTATTTDSGFSATLPVNATLTSGTLNGVGALSYSEPITIVENGSPSSTAYFAFKSPSFGGTIAGRFTFTYTVA